MWIGVTRHFELLKCFKIGTLIGIRSQPKKKEMHDKEEIDKHLRAN